MPRLDVTPDFSFDLIAILSSAKPHKLAWSINKNLHLFLQRQPDIELAFGTDNSIFFINFLHRTDHILFRLIRNKSIEGKEANIGYLLPELTQYDYLLLIDDQTSVYKHDFIKKVLSRISLIEHQLIVDPHTLKNKENLLFFQE